MKGFKQLQISQLTSAQMQIRTKNDLVLRISHTYALHLQNTNLTTPEAVAVSSGNASSTQRYCVCRGNTIGLADLGWKRAKPRERKHMN